MQKPFPGWETENLFGIAKGCKWFKIWDYGSQKHYKLPVGSKICRFYWHEVQLHKEMVLSRSLHQF